MLSMTELEDAETEPSVVQASLLRRLSHATDSLLVLRGVVGLLQFR